MAHKLPQAHKPFSTLIDYKTALMIHSSINTNYPIFSSNFSSSSYESRNKVKKTISLNKQKTYTVPED